VQSCARNPSDGDEGPPDGEPFPERPQKTLKRDAELPRSVDREHDVLARHASTATGALHGAFSRDRWEVHLVWSHAANAAEFYENAVDDAHQH
jgi:hypothetical protein